ncbi:acetyl-CoA synthetase-like protein [Xylaria cf. heliscus]|nr:acetyl-CoA synthetase-like protein [Xylaria cf. heliscus]
MTTQHSKIARWQGDLLPHIVDRLASETPSAIYGLWPVAPASYQAGFREINYAQLANIVNGLAWWIVDQLGTGDGEQVLTYIGPNDVRYCALVLAASKTGYVMFLTSPRNSPAAHQALFNELKCQTLLTTDPVPPPVAAVMEAVKPRKFTIPSVDDLLGTVYPAYVYTKTYEQAQREPLIIIHTSGSTGIPKPIIWTHATGARHQNLSAIPAPEGVNSVDSVIQGRRVMVTLPPFHGGGVTQYLFNSIPFGNISIAPAATGIVTAQGLVEALGQTPADVAVLVPSVVAELAQNPDLLEICAQYLKVILYIGGDLPVAVGDKVATKIPLRCLWGASEVGIPQQLMPSELGPLDWRYIRFHPNLGAVFQEAMDGVYELVIQRGDEIASTQGLFTIRGQDKLQEYRTKDLFTKHPTVSDAWSWRARADDIIVFLNGEKTNPVSMEQHIVAENHELSGALVVGSQRFQPALLIEPTAGSGPMTTADQAALIERIWPSVEEANRAAPAHARVEKSLVLVTTPDRPFIRSGKGTIQRPGSLAQYTEDIDKLYRNAELSQDDTISGTIYTANTQEVTSLIQDAIQKITGWAILDKSDSFFDRGLDSLQALQITRALRRALHSPDFALSTIYQNPTVEQLTAAVLERDNKADEREMMEPLLITYKGLIQQIPVPKTLNPVELDSIDVLLTGSTGSLGTLILRALLDRPGINHIFCLNRGADGGRSVQGQRFSAAGLDDDRLNTRVTFLQADLAHPSLALDDATYETLRTRVGLIIHNAWPVNFNLNLSAFRPHLAGLVNLCRLSAAAAPRAVQLLFISSVGAVSGEALQGGAAPETVLDSFETPGPNGYSRSKFLSELLCDVAAKNLGIPVTVVRVGQVAGPVKLSGTWNRAEWLPSLVISSLHLNCLPENLGTRFSEIDWVPSDLLADVVVDLATTARHNNSVEKETGLGAAVFNLRNPSTTTWDKLLSAIVECASTKQQGQGCELEVVSPSVWVERLQQSMVAVTEDDNSDVAAAAAANPAIKLVEFYQSSLWGSSMVATRPMSVELAVQASPTLGVMSSVGGEWMRKWVDGWLATA